MFDWNHYLLALGTMCSIAVVTWIVSWWKKDVSIVDTVWAVMIWSGGAVYGWTASGLSTRGWITLCLLTIWAARLSLYIAARNHGEPEDRRYQSIRANNEPHFAVKSLYIVFLLQALLAWVVSLPLLGAVHGTRALNLLDAVAILLIAAGIAFEAVADWQLSRFKRAPQSRGKVLETGLWRYSRHPNYFGECCVWWGFGLLAFATGAWWSFVSPILMTILLLRVSGVHLLERDIAERRPQYVQYVQSTSAFVPWPPRRANGTHQATRE